MSFQQISHINLFAKDSKKLIHFYKEALGIPALPHQDENSNWYGLETEHVQLAIEPEKNKQKVEKELNIQRHDSLLIQFQASSMEELVQMSEHLEQKNVQLFRKVYKASYGYITNFQDPEGNFLEIYLPFEKS